MPSIAFTTSGGRLPFCDCKAVKRDPNCCSASEGTVGAAVDDVLAVGGKVGVTVLGGGGKVGFSGA